MSVVPKHKKITVAQIHEIARQNNLDPYLLQSFVEVEGSGIGFSDVTGRLLIQFEPHLMKKYIQGKPIAPSSTWMNNGVGNQTVEYNAFNDACRTDRAAAMKATSIGMMQVLGVHYSRLGYKSVNDMWVDADQNEANQVRQGVKFITTDSRMLNAFRERNYHLMAYYYNGSGYQALARRLGVKPYDQRIRETYERLLKSAKYNQTATTVNIRSGPGVFHGTVSAPLRVNTLVEVLEQKEGWSRVRVISTGLVGWVSSAYIK